jgi:hypothetical protein
MRDFFRRPLQMGLVELAPPKMDIQNCINRHLFNQPPHLFFPAIGTVLAQEMLPF